MTFVNRVNIENNFRMKLDSLYQNSYNMSSILNTIGQLVGFYEIKNLSPLFLDSGNFQITADDNYNIIFLYCGKHKHIDDGITLRLIDIVPVGGVN